MGEQSAHASNLALQRESALKFREEWPNVEKIRFTREGGRPGLGAPWSANAVAAVLGTDYQVIIGPSTTAFPTGYPPPDAPTPHVTSPLTIIYSDGTTEELG